MCVPFLKCEWKNDTCWMDNNKSPYWRLNIVSNKRRRWWYEMPWNVIFRLFIVMKRDHVQRIEWNGEVLVSNSLSKELCRISLIRSAVGMRMQFQFLRIRKLSWRELSERDSDGIHFCWHYFCCMSLWW